MKLEGIKYIGEIQMNKDQEVKLTGFIKDEMLKVRNAAMASGMKASLTIVLDICNKNKTDEEKIIEIKDFCERGLHNGETN